MDSPSLVLITDVVDNYLFLKGNWSASNFQRYLHIVLNGRQYYGFTSSTEYKTVNLTISALNVIDVPIDFIDYVRIGMESDNQIWTLTKNNNIVLPTGISCGALTSADTTPIADATLWLDFSSTGGKNFMYYRYDKESRRIVFRGDGVGREVILEYISDGVSMDAETYVPSDMVPMLTAYLEWQLKLYGDKENKSNSDTEYYGREFRACRKDYQSSKLKFTADELLDTIRGTHKQTIKR